MKQSLDHSWTEIEKFYPPVDGKFYKYCVTCMTCLFGNQQLFQTRDSCDEWARQHAISHPKKERRKVTFAYTIVKIK